MDSIILENLAKLPGAKFDVPLDKYTTFGLGGQALCMCFPQTDAEMVVAVKEIKRLKVPFFILGNGSNLLISDEGYPEL
jgi:UDP-N-acetylmuramate dehydrogenase